MSEDYFDRMTRTEGNLAEIRKMLGVPHQAQRITLQRIADLQNLAAKWVNHQDRIVGGPELMGWDG